MKKINKVEDISLDDLNSILIDLEYYPKNIYQNQEIDILQKAIRIIINDILDFNTGKGADEIIMIDKIIKTTNEIYAIYDFLYKDLNRSEAPNKLPEGDEK